MNGGFISCPWCIPVNALYAEVSGFVFTATKKISKQNRNRVKPGDSNCFLSTQGALEDGVRMH